MPTSQTWSGIVHGSVGIAYDSLLRAKSLTVNGSSPITFGYDRDDMLTSAGALSIVRDPVSGRSLTTALSGVTTTATYNDSVGTLMRLAAKFGASTLFDATFTRDTVGRVTGVVETIQGVTTTQAFVYDSVGRLDQVRRNGVLVADYDYDVNGNRSRLTTPNGTLTSVVDAQDRLLGYGSTTFSYGSNGELVRKASGPDTTTYSYDVFGNLLTARVPDGRLIEYLVDPQNRRIGKKVNGVLVKGILYQGQLSPIAELDSANNVVSRFVYGDAPNVPEYMVKGGVTYRLITDQLGSVRLVVNSTTGDVAQRIDYDEFGRVLGNTNPGFQPFGFAGGLYDDDTKLVRFGARDYDAETGRWTAKDPLGFAAGQENFYVYVGNDPINSIDPDGLRCRGLGRELFSFVPVAGPGLDAIDDFQDGNYVWGTVDVGMAALDLTGVGELAKGGWKVGSTAWKNVRAWLGREGLAEKFQHVHHAFIPQGGWGAAFPDWFKNQWWNLKPLEPWKGYDMNKWHEMVDGRRPGLEWEERLWHGSPDWAKSMGPSAAMKAGAKVGRGACGCR
jgi:RHS repeat-associated protein